MLEAALPAGRDAEGRRAAPAGRSAAWLERLLAVRTARPRFASWSVTSFGSLALLLAVSGIYSVLALGVRRRRREMAIRLALGAAPARIVGLILKRLCIWLTMGVALGLIGGATVTGLARGLLYETSPVEPVIITAVAAMFCVGGFIAALGPALYASQSDPAQLLRSD
jgi:putative ABC transport system permease protein